MRNLDSCRCWRRTLCPCKVRSKFLINFWNRTILLCIPILQLTAVLFDQRTIVCLTMRWNRSLKKGGFKNLKLRKQVGQILTEARRSCSRIPGRVAGSYDSKSPLIRNHRCTYVRGEDECGVDTNNTYNCDLCWSLSFIMGDAMGKSSEDKTFFQFSLTTLSSNAIELTFVLPLWEIKHNAVHIITFTMILGEAVSVHETLCVPNTSQIMDNTLYHILIM